MRSLLAVADKEFKEIFRNPVTLLLAFGVPVVFFFVFGIGINLDVENLPLAVVDMDGSKLSADFSEQIYNNRYFTLVGYMSRSQAERLMRLNKLRAILIIPPGFARRLYEGRTSTVQVLVDGTYPYRADVIKGYMAGMVSRFNEALLRDWLGARGMKPNLEPVSLDVRVLYNQSIKSAYSLVPGVFVIVILMNTTILASLSVARERDYGSIYNIYTSSLSKFAFVVGKIVPYWFVGMVNVATMLLLALLLFRIPFRGDPVAFALSSGVYVLAACLLGILVSIFTRSMIAAQIVSMIITVIPAFLYSGYLMPVSFLEPMGQIEARMLPAMHYMNACRGIFLKGFGIGDVLSSVCAMLVFCACIFALSMLLFKKREG